MDYGDVQKIPQKIRMMASSPILPTINEDEYQNKKRDMKTTVLYSLSNLKNKRSDVLSKTALDQFVSINQRRESVQHDEGSTMSRQDRELALKAIYQKKKDLKV